MDIHKELDDVIGVVTSKRDEIIIKCINDWNFDWDHIWLNHNWEEISQILTERVSHTLDKIGATKEGLHHAMEIDRELSKKYPFDNSKEANLKRLATKKAIVEKEIDFWRKID